MNCTDAHRGSGLGFAVAIVVAGLFALAGHAHAGDRAQVEVIGFSPDARFVAYEQYGIQDGSGYPYAVITIFNLEDNAPVSESPIAVTLDDDVFVEATSRVAIAAAREAALTGAERVLDLYGIVPGETGTVLIHRPYSDLSEPQLEVPFSIGANFSPYLRDENLLRLTLTPTETDICSEMAPSDVFLLKLDLIQADGEAVTPLHDEDALPRDYFCPTEFRIHTVVIHAPHEPEYASCCADRYGMLVLLGAQTFPGFEGPDYRFHGFGAMVDRIGR